MNTVTKIALAEKVLQYVSQRWYLNEEKKPGNDCLVLYSEEIAQAVLNDSSDEGNMKVQSIMKLLMNTMHSVSFNNIIGIHNEIEFSGQSISCYVSTTKNNAKYEIASVFDGSHLVNRYAKFFLR